MLPLLWVLPAMAVTDAAPVDAAVGVAALLGSDEVVCSGTLVAPRWVLSSGDCVESVLAYLANDIDMAVAFGTDLAVDGTRVELVGAVLHPDHVEDTYSAVAVGLVELVEDAPVPPVVLAAASPDDLAVGEEVALTGFGASAGGVNDVGVLRTGTTAIYGVDDAFITTDTSGSNWCTGDGGGPLTDLDGQVMGIAQYVFGIDGTSGCEGSGGAASRVDAVVEWIDATVEGLPGGADTGADSGSGDTGSGDTGGGVGGGGVGGGEKGCASAPGPMAPWVWLVPLALAARRGASTRQGPGAVDRAPRGDLLVWAGVSLVSMCGWLVLLASGPPSGLTPLGLALPGLLPLAFALPVLRGPPGPLPQRPAVVVRGETTLILAAPASPVEGGLLALLLLGWPALLLAILLAVAVAPATSLGVVQVVCSVNWLAVAVAILRGRRHTAAGTIRVDRAARRVSWSGARESLDLYSLVRVDRRKEALVLRTLDEGHAVPLPGASRALLESVAETLRTIAEPLGAFDPAQARGRKAARAALGPVVSAAD